MNIFRQSEESVYKANISFVDKRRYFHFDAQRRLRQKKSLKSGLDDDYKVYKHLRNNR